MGRVANSAVTISFLAFAETARAAAEIGNMAHVVPVIEAWRATAEIHADPELYKALTRPLDATDHGPGHPKATD